MAEPARARETRTAIAGVGIIVAAVALKAGIVPSIQYVRALQADVRSDRLLLMREIGIEAMMASGSIGTNIETIRDRVLSELHTADDTLLAFEEMREQVMQAAALAGTSIASCTSTTATDSYTAQSLAIHTRIQATGPMKSVLAFLPILENAQYRTSILEAALEVPGVGNPELAQVEVLVRSYALRSTAGDRTDTHIGSASR